MDFFQPGEALTVPANERWRKAARYERYVLPLLIELQTLNWPAVVEVHRAAWQRAAITDLLAIGLKPGGYCWRGDYALPGAKASRLIQLARLYYGLYPVRLCPPGGPSVGWGSWFRPNDLKASGWELSTWQLVAFKKGSACQNDIFDSTDEQATPALNRRRFLAKRLLAVARQLGSYTSQTYWNSDNTITEVETFQLNTLLEFGQSARRVGGGLTAGLSGWGLGELEAKLDRFKLCLKEFHEAELPISASATPTLPALEPAPTSEERRIFDMRWDEFRNVVEMSFSTPEDDADVTVYDVNERVAGEPGLWCPVQCAEAPHERWQNYSARKREAIRLGFMHGLCKMIDLVPPPTLADWRSLRPDVCKPWIYERCFNPITAKAERTGDYAAGRLQMEEKLRTVYEAGQHIPYHPNFGSAFLATLGVQRLSELDDFLAGYCLNRGLATPEGYTYLLALVSEANDAGGPLSPTLVTQSLNWLRAALDPRLRRAALDMAAAPGPAGSYSWAKIDQLAETIGLREAGQFRIAGNRIGAAVAGLIDALREAEIVPRTATLPTLYAEFSRHYGRPVNADRVTPTRADWQRKAREALGLP